MFGDYLVVSFFVAWATAAGRRPFVYLALPLLFAGIRATASNGALMSLLGGCCAWFAATSTFWTRRTLGILCVAGGILLGVVGVYHEEITQFAVDMGSAGRGEVGGAAMKGASERLPIWKTIAEQVIATPIGVGPGNFAGVDAMTTGDDHGAHNEYLGMLAERGFLGLAGWLALMATLFLMLFRVRAASFAGFRPFGPEALFGLFGAMCAHSLVIELSHFRHTWMVFALISATALQAARVRPAPAAIPADAPEPLDPGLVPADIRRSA
jgi:O-antigen ligase